jgi:cysteine desulfurase
MLHLITSAIEHKAVLDTCYALEDHSHITLTVLSPDETGIITPEQVDIFDTFMNE